MHEKVIEETIKAFLLVEAIAPTDFNNNNNNNSNSNQIHELCIKHNLLDIYDKLTIAMNFNSIEQLAMADDNDTEEMIQFLGLKFGNKASLKLLIKDAKKQYNTIINNESTASLQEGKVNDEINKKTDKRNDTKEINDTNEKKSNKRKQMDKTDDENIDNNNSNNNNEESDFDNLCDKKRQKTNSFRINRTSKSSIQPICPSHVKRVNMINTYVYDKEKEEDKENIANNNNNNNNNKNYEDYKKIILIKISEA